jgi:hypothetical protein
VLVEPLGKRFGEAIRERLQQDVVIIVVRGLEALEVRFEAVERNGEAAEPILLERCDEIGEAHVGAAGAFLDLLAKEWEARALLVENDDVIAFALDRPEADGRTRGEPFLGNDLVEHRLRIREQAAGAFADNVVVEDGWIIAGQFPGAKNGVQSNRERGPRAASLSKTCAPGWAGRGLGTLAWRREAIGACLRPKWQGRFHRDWRAIREARDSRWRCG